MGSLLQFWSGTFEGMSGIRAPARENTLTVPLILQIAQNRSYLHMLGPKVGIIYILGAIGFQFLPGLSNAVPFWVPE